MALEAIQMNEKTIRIEDGFVRMFLLIGEKKALLIDSGISGTDVKKFCETLTDLPVELLNTHGDKDHVGSNQFFSSFYLHEKDAIGCGLLNQFPKSQISFVDDGLRIDLGGRTVEIIEIPGHTKGSVAVLDIDQRVLYSGDSVQDGHIYMFGQHREPELFAASLKKLQARISDFDVIYPSHGTPVLSNDYVQKVYDAWHKVLSKEIVSKNKEIHGSMIRSYDDEDCGFYCE